MRRAAASDVAENRSEPAGTRVILTSEAGFGLDWLQKMWDSHSLTLYHQVGIGNGNNKTVSDHDIWRLPQADDTYGGTDPTTRYIRNRPAFAGPAGSPISPAVLPARRRALGQRVHRRPE